MTSDPKPGRRMVLDAMPALAFCLAWLVVALVLLGALG